jgi:hypothetical protein
VLRRWWLAATLLALPVCSTVDRDGVDECRDDSDCNFDEICSLAQGNKCVPAELPPQAAIGFEISEGTDLRVELMGCDPEVNRELGGTELRVQKRSELVDDYNIEATTRRSVLNCGGDECAGECDEQALTCSEPTEAEFTLTMVSRLGLAALSESMSPEPPAVEGDPPPPVPFRWPTYESPEANAHAALVLDVRPIAELSTIGSFRRIIAEDASEDVDALGVLRCQRGLYSSIEGAVRTWSGSPVIGANVEFRYAEPIATQSTVIGTAPGCGDADDCPPGWACVAGSCGLDLTNVVAGSSASTDELVGGFPPAWVYTYCEETVAPLDDPIIRNFTVTVTPPAESGLPTVLYSLAQPFVDPFSEESSQRWVEIENDEDETNQFCLPDWLPPQKVAFSVVGEPVALIDTELGDYSCCATDCLPSSEPGVEPTPPPMIDTCSSFYAASFDTRWFNDEDAWAFMGCVPTASDSDVSNGHYKATHTCDESGCSAPLTPGDGVLPRTYSVAITQPVGSVFQSQRFDVMVDTQTTELPPFQLTPRVLLRGTIECVDSEEHCVATNAEILAERLRVDSDPVNPLGPYFFNAVVDADGNFVLPVDPGVYAITAYPAVGQPGGPSDFVAVDLREDSAMIEMVGGVPNAILNDPLQLDDGILVTVALSGFDIATSVRPRDIGSWKALEGFPYDLNDPDTCYSEGGERLGCAIRRLRPNDAPITLLLNGRFQFTARTRGAETCN